jgi:hypothetical protein
MIMRAIAVALLTMGLFAVVGRAEERDEAWASNRVRQIKESDTTGWSRIPWVKSLLAARQASEKENRPVFLFTHDGNIETGRC